MGTVDIQASFRALQPEACCEDCKPVHIQLLASCHVSTCSSVSHRFDVFANTSVASFLRHPNAAGVIICSSSCGMRGRPDDAVKLTVSPEQSYVEPNPCWTCYYVLKMQCHAQLNGNTVDSVPVNSDGTYSGSFIAPSTPATYGVTAAFKPSAGSTVGAGTSPSSPLTVGPAVATIAQTLSPNPAAPSSGVTDAGTVTTTSGTPDGGTVTVFVRHLSSIPLALMLEVSLHVAQCFSTVVPHQVMAAGSELVAKHGYLNENTS